MSIFDRIKVFDFDKNRRGVFGIKSAIIWGHCRRPKSIFPVLYISKPRSISPEEFEELLDGIEIVLRRPKRQIPPPK